MIQNRRSRCCIARSYSVTIDRYFSLVGGPTFATYSGGCNCHATAMQLSCRNAREKRRLSAILPSRVSFCTFMQLMHRERPITYPPYMNSAVQLCAYVGFDVKIFMPPMFNEDETFRQARCLEQIETSLVRVLAESVCSPLEKQSR